MLNLNELKKGDILENTGYNDHKILHVDLENEFIVIKDMVKDCIWISYKSNIDFHDWNKKEARKADEDLYYEFIFYSKVIDKILKTPYIKIKKCPKDYSEYIANKAYKLINYIPVEVEFDKFVLYQDGSIRFLDEMEME